MKSMVRWTCGGSIPVPNGPVPTATTVALVVILGAAGSRLAPVPKRLPFLPPKPPTGLTVTAETKWLPAKVVKQVKEIRELGTVVAAATTERNGKTGKPWTALRKSVEKALETPNLPPQITGILRAIGPQVKSLEALEDLKAIVSKVDKELPTFDGLNHHLQALDGTRDARLAHRVRYYIAFNAALRGQVELAWKLAAPKALGGSAPARLRDLISIAVEAAFQPATHHAATPPGGKRPPQSPEGTRQSARPKPGTKPGDTGDGLPPPDNEEAAADNKFRARLDADLKKDTETCRHSLLEDIDLLWELTAYWTSEEKRQEMSKELQHRRDFEGLRRFMEGIPQKALSNDQRAVARLLNRELTLAEKARVPQLVRKGKRPAEIAASFAQTDSKAAQPGR